MSIPLFLYLALCFIIALSVIYVVAAAVVSLRPGKNARPKSTLADHGISVLKPLCGEEPRLFENLSTFCEQTHKRFELICSVASPSDPAIETVERLQAAYPNVDIRLVVDARIHGRNLKVSNLINAMQRARHDIIVLADSDITVTPDYLRTVTAPLAIRASAW